MSTKAFIKYAQKKARFFVEKHLFLLHFTTFPVSCFQSIYAFLRTLLTTLGKLPGIIRKQEPLFLFTDFSSCFV